MANNQLVFSLRHPFTCSVVGPTFSGKTNLVLELIERRAEIISHPLDRIIYIYTEDQEIFHEFQQKHPIVSFTKDMEVLKDITYTNNKRTLIVFDDKLLDFCGKENEDIIYWFTMGAHHRNCSIILLLQTAFAKSLRTVAINSMYLLLLNNSRDKSTITSLGKQTFPHKPKFLPEALERAVSKPFGYLFFVFHVLDNNLYRVRSSIYPSPDCEIYVPRSE